MAELAEPSKMKKNVDVTLATYSVNCRVKNPGHEHNRPTQCPQIVSLFYFIFYFFFIQLTARLQLNIGFTLRHVMVVFTFG